MSIVGVGSYSRYASAFTKTGTNKATSSAFAEAMNASSAMPGQSHAAGAASSDFRSMTKSDFVAWGKDQYQKGNISLDDLFHVQWAGGDLDGSAKTDATPQNFVTLFQDRIRFMAERGEASDPRSTIGNYRHVLSLMGGSVSITA